MKGKKCSILFDEDRHHKMVSIHIDKETEDSFPGEVIKEE